jgi:hypothetical protein
MSSHAPGPLQLTSQCDPLEQVTSLQALSPLQLIVQLHPDGHVIAASQSSGALHSIMHVRAPSSQVVQSSGQFWTTQ